MVLLYTSPSLTVTAECPPLMNPAGGIVNVPSRIEGSNATYTCNEGYDLLGDSFRTCDETAMWTGNEPVCQSKEIGIVLLYLCGM